MGADFLVAVITMPKEKNPDWVAGANHIRALRKLPIDEWPEDYIDNLGIYELEEDENNSGEKDEHAYDLFAGLREVKRVWEGGRTREATELEIGGERVLLTGGQSWGDPPTDLYETIGKLWDAGVFTACGFN